MLTVDIDLWPMGDFQKARRVRRVCICNYSTEEDVVTGKQYATYCVVEYQVVGWEHKALRYAVVYQFDRSLGAPELLRVCMNALHDNPMDLDTLDSELKHQFVDLKLICDFEEARRVPASYRQLREGSEQ